MITAFPWEASGPGSGIVKLFFPNTADVVVTSSSLNVDLALNRDTSLTTFAEPIDILPTMQASEETA